MHLFVSGWLVYGTYFREVGGEVSMQDLVEVQQRPVGQVLWNTAEGQARVVEVSKEQSRQVCGKAPVSTINTTVWPLMKYNRSPTGLTPVYYRRTELIWSTVIRERDSAEWSKVRRQLRACLATYRPAEEEQIIIMSPKKSEKWQIKVLCKCGERKLKYLLPVFLPRSHTRAGLKAQWRLEPQRLHQEVWK